MSFEIEILDPTCYSPLEAALQDQECCWNGHKINLLLVFTGSIAAMIEHLAVFANFTLTMSAMTANVIFYGGLCLAAAGIIGIIQNCLCSSKSESESVSSKKEKKPDPTPQELLEHEILSGDANSLTKLLKSDNPWFKNTEFIGDEVGPSGLSFVELVMIKKPENSAIFHIINNKSKNDTAYENIRLDLGTQYQNLSNSLNQYSDEIEQHFADIKEEKQITTLTNFWRERILTNVFPATSQLKMNKDDFYKTDENGHTPIHKACLAYDHKFILKVTDPSMGDIIDWGAKCFNNLLLCLEEAIENKLRKFDKALLAPGEKENFISLVTAIAKCHPGTFDINAVDSLIPNENNSTDENNSIDKKNSTKTKLTKPRSVKLAEELKTSLVKRNLIFQRGIDEKLSAIKLEFYKDHGENLMKLIDEQETNTKNRFKKK